MKRKKLFIGMLVLAVALGITVNLSQRSQETRNFAQDQGCKCEISQNCNSFDVCVGCSRCMDKVKGEGLGKAAYSGGFVCKDGFPKERVTWREYCSNPDLYEPCTSGYEYGFNYCQCCRLYNDSGMDCTTGVSCGLEPTGIPGVCSCTTDGTYCYDRLSEYGGKQYNPCLGCTMCKEKNTADELPLMSMIEPFYCSALGRDVILGEYCQDPSAFVDCKLSIDLCQCCNVSGIDMYFGRLGRCSQGICGTVTPTSTPTLTPTNTPTPTQTPTPTNTPTPTVTLTPTLTPTNTPTLTPTITPTITPTNTPTNTPTEVPKVWENMCKSVYQKSIYICSDCMMTGDYNCDGVINGGDYVTWRNEFLDRMTGSRLQADGNCDGKVSISDYSKWREAYLK